MENDGSLLLLLLYASQHQRTKLLLSGIPTLLLLLLLLLSPFASPLTQEGLRLTHPIYSFPHSTHQNFIFLIFSKGSISWFCFFWKN
ncbi:hypothetical protein Lalb_Chr06g0160831 [Lupinus albus]|uniref:Uncharacterized protein n=1 Tax=Lupinus albus TaxID=3870 RepID=A0A6A4QCR0_LUPAL|nr:hypothetical protein Lalb_Chr06g0160831 [Lupinus albus]